MDEENKDVDLEEGIEKKELATADNLQEIKMRISLLKEKLKGDWKRIMLMVGSEETPSVYDEYDVDQLDRIFWSQETNKPYYEIYNSLMEAYKETIKTKTSSTKEKAHFYAGLLGQLSINLVNKLFEHLADYEKLVDRQKLLIEKLELKVRAEHDTYHQLDGSAKILYNKIRELTSEMTNELTTLKSSMEGFVEEVNKTKTTTLEAIKPKVEVEEKPKKLKKPYPKGLNSYIGKYHEVRRLAKIKSPEEIAEGLNLDVEKVRKWIAK